MPAAYIFYWSLDRLFNTKQFVQGHRSVFLKGLKKPSHCAGTLAGKPFGMFVSTATLGGGQASRISELDKELAMRSPGQILSKHASFGMLKSY